MATNRKSVNLLPAYFRTEKNSKFLASTLDQLISPPQLNRIDAYVGSKDTPTYQLGDQYLPEIDPFRKAYQLEPALVIKSLDQEIKKAFALDDLLNQITIQGGNSTNLDKIFNPKFYSYDPKIDWDKFINYRSYYWVPNGPDAITISGNQKNPIVEFSITDYTDGIQFLFGGLTTTEKLVLYRGYTYVFNVESTHNFYIKYTNRVGEDDQVTGKYITGNGTKKGQIVFTVDWSLPETLFYTSNDNQLSTGSIVIKEPTTNSTINLQEEILGKQFYTTSSGIKFINGLKIKFDGIVFPESYRDAEFIVEGVGSGIRLVRFSDLDTPDNVAELYNSKFDGSNFDNFPFDDFKNIPIVPEYVTINRSSSDRNPWSRYNRWVHRDVLITTANSNSTQVVFSEKYRAVRPIIEFKSDIQLFNFGTTAIHNVDLIDNAVVNAFDQVEGQVGYYIDGVLLEEGFRIIFNSDQDSIIRNKVYKVTFSKNVDNTFVINLIEDTDAVVNGAAVLVKRGVTHAGTSWHHNGTEWLFSQQRNTRNQAPLFDLFDKLGNSYFDKNYYSTNFAGNKIFGYGIGTGSNDKILGFPLLYKNVGVEGTYLFKNYFSTEEFLLIKQPTTSIISTAQTYFKVNSNLSTIWITAKPYTVPNTNGIYEVPLNLSNNPMSLPISELTLTELSDHLQTMIDRHPDYVVKDSVGNVKDLPDIATYGTRLISNLNPFSFAHHFITDQENSLIDATRVVGEHYYQFKFNFFKAMADVMQENTPADTLDSIIAFLNKNKTTTFPYYSSDMLPHGAGNILRTYSVTDSRNTRYPLPNKFSAFSLSTAGVLIYLNGELLLHGTEYQFDDFDANVEILVPLIRGDILTLKEYSSTNGSFVPPTPTKLGLYPKYQPKMFIDDTYAGTPIKVIQGHDGSITVAFNDYRDDVLLEFEKRIFNNIKVDYKQDLFDVNSILPGIFREQEYSYDQTLVPVFRDFLKWKTSYSVEAEKNLTFDINNPRTFNYHSIILPNGSNAPGNWRSIFKLYFDTDRPHTHPWEMLGFSVQPTWWEDTYGPAPYTSGNDILWNDIAAGRIVQGARAGVDPIYSRPGLLEILPVDENGNLIDIRYWGILGKQGALLDTSNNWVYGDGGPAETAWRRSSYWPFAVQIIMAICKPALYASLMFDTSRMVKNAVGNYVYSEDNQFLSPARMVLPYINGVTLTSGYSVFVVEAGLIKSSNYLTNLQIELQNSNFNLMNKVGGFVGKDKLEVVIESVDPASINPGILLPVEDYTIHFNTSNPIKTIAISGVIIQKSQGTFVVRGYDKVTPYFEVLMPIHQKADKNIVVGATSEDYTVWSVNVFYSQGQVVTYQNTFYRVVGNHNSGDSFNATYYRVLPTLPSIGGTSVQHAVNYENSITKISYGTTFNTLQEVADVLAGYGKWLESEGFLFNEYSTDLGELLNWEFSIKEFLFWATQNWSDNNVITLSPFANKIEYQFTNSIVDDIFNSFYDYSLLKSDGYPYPSKSFSISRINNVCSIISNAERDGLFFARLRLIQKEHAIIFNNTSRFNDIIYDTETGYRQRRVRLIGFRTTEWNGDFFSPGFVYDSATLQSWKPYADYIAGDVVEYAGNYYSLVRNLTGTEKFDFTKWDKLDSKPQAQLIPNFEYKISQFEDFYSLDIDNFDISQQQLAQHLVGYSSRVYLDNIFLNPIAQYKFYQGFIREKGTRNSLEKLAKASVHNLNGRIDFKEEWAFRVGSFGAYSSEIELEFPLLEDKVVDNTQLIQFVNEKPSLEYNSTVYITPSDFTISSPGYSPDLTFPTIPSTIDDNNIIMPVAGYVRLDDVDFALKTKQDLYSFVPGKTIKIGDTIWIGFDDTGDWGVYRYSRLPQTIISATAKVAGQSVTFTTDKYHTLVVGDIIAISRFSDTLNGIYKIDAVPHLNEFTVITQSPVETTNDVGILFKFVSSRYSTFDDLVTADYIADIGINKSIWVDNALSGKWKVYTKINNYESYKIKGLPVDASYFGQKIISKESSNLLLVSAPSYDDGTGAGKIFVYKNINGTIKLSAFYGVNSQNNQYYNNTTAPHPTQFGQSIDYDSADGLIVAGAPFASNIKGSGADDTRFVKSSYTADEYTNEGLVVVSTLDPTSGTESRKLMIAPGLSNAASNLEFGASVFVGSTSTNKILLIGAPGHNVGMGKVFSYNLAYTKSFDGQTIEVNSTNTSQNFLPSPIDTYDARFGEHITGDLVGNTIAVSAPGFNNGNGAVCVFKRTGTGDYDSKQTIRWDDLNTPTNVVISTGSNFGYSINIDDSGEWLFISAYTAKDNSLQPGKVLVYRDTTGTFTCTQIINNPSSTPDLKFGFSLESDETGQVLGVTSIGPTNYSGMIFDSGNTTFDSVSTNFSEYIQGAGTAYTFNRYGDKFVYASELFDAYVTPGSLYGTSISVNRNAVYVGAPLFITADTTKAGEVYVWNAIDPTLNSWALSREQEDLVDVYKIKQTKTINTLVEQIGDYLEVYDPIKGKISEVADQEIRYKTVFDPAVYNAGTSTSVTVDLKTYWGAEHVGELWWDLSSVKYVWYEQGDIEFRKNSWGTLFPGCSIDIYEWIETEFTPDVWLASADSALGLAQGISGTPKYLADLAYTLEPVYSAISDSITNKYYYWVKNTVVVPNRQGRTLSAYEVSNLISNPKLAGLKYLQVLSNNAVSVTNVKGSLINERISLNIQIDKVNNSNNRHTEWLLIEEGSAHSLPNTFLEKKLIDSILGRDSLGNPVPDPTLSPRQKYGIGIRPRQSMFKDRLTALKNLVDYINLIFKNNLITDFYSLKNLTDKDSISDIPVKEYDIIVEDIAKRDTIYVGELVQANLECTLVDGKINEVVIIDSGFGYGKLEVATYDEFNNPKTWKGPEVKILDDNNGAKFETIVDEHGSIILVLIINQGSNYSSVPQLTVRPYTVVVQTDETAQGRWSLYALMPRNWVKVKTQRYDTTLYWEFTNWVSPEFNQYQSITTTIDQQYQLAELDLNPGDYVKVKNNGAGRYIILKKLESNSFGTYDTNFDILVSENGTIRIKDSIWDTSNSQFGWDQIIPYDDTFFDQAPDIELEKIILALKNDIFVGNLKVYWNKFFFAAVKYTLTEQKVIDWAFKTSFINVLNLAGELTQRPVYKFQDTTWYEDYLKEIKPYHTQIREYKLEYSVTEPSLSQTTDFDLPVVFNKENNSYDQLLLTSPVLQQYPYKNWFDNHTLYLESIAITVGGSGYTEIPEIRIISAPTDSVSRIAKATAIIASGKVIGAEIIDPGEGYTITPSVLVIGGGNGEISTAKASAIMNNKKVRLNLVGLKFDRISKIREIGSKTATDQFTADGIQTEFLLSWVALVDEYFVVRANGIFVNPSDYTVEDFKNTVNGYNKLFTKLTFVSQYDQGTVINVSYVKSLKIYNAYDRIADYYNPTSGMPGKTTTDNYAQLMAGMEYPETKIETQTFETDFSWDSVPFASLLWDPASSQTINLDTIYSGGSISTSTPWISGHWTPIDGTVVTTSTPWISADMQWTKVTNASTSTPWIAGHWNSKKSDALGINPQDIILDGDEFISPNTTYAPEELIPGHVSETLGINVFTRAMSGSSLIYRLKYPGVGGVGSVIPLTAPLPSFGSLLVTYENATLLRNVDYAVDLNANVLTVYPRESSGSIEVIYMPGVGGTGFLSSNSIVHEGESTGTIVGDCAFSEVKSAYVSSNGIRVDEYNGTNDQNLYFVLTNADGRASAVVHGLGTLGKNILFAAFFNTKYKGFSETREQITFEMNANNRILTLDQPPGTLGPASANSIVEVNGVRIVPPNTTYYEITNINQTVFDISTRRVFPHNSFDMTLLEVYKNGVRISVADYYLDQYNNTVIFPSNYFALGDVLAITAIIDYDYIIRGNKLEINNRIPFESETNVVRIITFTNQDESFIRTEVYLSNSARLYKLSRQMTNDSYVWVSIGDKTLVSGYDFVVLDDGRTIQLDVDIPFITGEQIIITSFSFNTSNRTIGFKMFKDPIGRSSFKRLSLEETTYLIVPLQLTDTEIVVEDGNKLPNVSANSTVPGVIFIAGERIEYLAKNGNTLSNIKRATLGTGAKPYYTEGSWVIDQSQVQNMPPTERVTVITTSTDGSSSYKLSSDLSFISNASYHDQVEVYFGGRLLEKPTAPGVVRYAHDYSASYDSGAGNIILTPGFTITTSTVDQSTVYMLNLPFNPPRGIELKIVQRKASSWYTIQTVSLLDDVSLTSVFLRDRNTIAVDQLYYGGDLVLRLGDGSALTLDDGRPIEGY